mmetsp:Transcript_853/g.1937  ORF Transcript_853/g.1937 Transcript_853/m.1937 type:complete len:203 (+) Transcript_853:31-639(+)
MGSSGRGRVEWGCALFACKYDLFHVDGSVAVSPFVLRKLRLERCRLVMQCRLDLPLLNECLHIDSGVRVPLLKHGQATGKRALLPNIVAVDFGACAREDLGLVVDGSLASEFLENVLGRCGGENGDFLNLVLFRFWFRFWLRFEFNLGLWLGLCFGFGLGLGHGLGFGVEVGLGLSLFYLAVRVGGGEFRGGGAELGLLGHI